jgi:hypothetical protein
MKPIKQLEGKTIAIVGLGRSWFDYNLAASHGDNFDEVWGINAVGSVIYHDRTFMMDPPSRFLDTDNAGGQTTGMKRMLTTGDKPIYTCELDARAKNLVLYPIDEIVADLNCCYLNNTVAYAIAFALWNKVGTLKIYGVDFTYKGNLHFAESGRACVEFWLSKCMHANMQVGVAGSSTLLDTNVETREKLYGYHRLKDPLVPLMDGKKMIVKKMSQLSINKTPIEPQLIGRHDDKTNPVEPKEW